MARNDLQQLLKPSVGLPAIILVSWLSYISVLIIYRLVLSPIAKFPGPKLAALTKWYEFYYEAVLGGKFTFHIQKLHQKYGPIIRITPDELHVMDPDYWDELYVRNHTADKYEWMAGRFGNNSSIFTTSHHDIHRRRRAPLSPMFSRRQIVQLQPLIQKKIDQLCRRFEYHAQTKTPFPIDKACSAFAGDVVTEYSFGFCYNHLDCPGFRETFHEAFMAVSAFGHIALQFPWLHPFLNSLPDKWVQTMNPDLFMLLKLQRDLRATIARIANGDEPITEKRPYPTIFHEMLESDLPPEDKAFPRLGDEAQTVIGAGLVTTAWALSVACFHIINDPKICQTLQEELWGAITESTAPLDLQQLEKLPYLKGCIQEGIRMSYGVTARNPRLASKPTTYKEWVIPARTPVSMTIVDVHDDESVFPDHRSFLPERWMNNPRTSNGSPLDRYLVAFGKGPRSCLGINLAYAELHMMLAAVFRRFSFELYQTDVSNVELAHDFFLPSPKLDSKGIRVKVTAVHP